MKQHGISKIVVSPGSRHFPIIHSMEADDYFEMYSVVDERSAAFFALGLIQQSDQPVAICCTSGTSAINYGSAVVEAFYQGLPLVVITADRLPELLGQKEEQMFKQDTVFDGFIKYRGQLKEVKDRFSEWYCNRVINEAFLALNGYEKGPVHLNIPIERHHLDTFETPQLPVARKITKTTADVDDEIWESYAARLKGKKILILWGQSNVMSDKTKAAVDLFTSKYNCVILADKLANCHLPRTIQSAFPIFYAMTPDEKRELAPDILISVHGNFVYNGEIKGFITAYASGCEHWDIGKDTVCDPFKKLTEIFEMNVAFFFRRISQYDASAHASNYFEKWNNIAQLIEEPNVNYGELYAIGELMRTLPANSSLQIANSLPIRMTHLFNTNPSIKVFCNRGVNGIDGCMSTAVGYAARSEEPVFLIIGDLTFFYDMNALWNRHLSNNIRILLLNNEGGGVMHVPLKEEMAPILAKHVSAGHATSAKGWVESIGVKYLAATNKQEFDQAVAILTDMNVDGPILLEVFSKKEDDVKVYKQQMKGLNRETFADKVKRRVKAELKKVLPK